MRLTLSTRHPRNSAYLTDTGVVLYKTDKPNKLGPANTTIRKAVGTVNGVWQGNFNQLYANPTPLARKKQRDTLIRDYNSFRWRTSSDDGAALRAYEAPVFEGHFAFYAQVEFHKLHPTRFRYDGRDVPVNEYFRKGGWSFYGRDQVFRASDGREYCWQLRAACLDMIVNDGSKKQVVKYTEYHPELGPIMKGRPGTLEIDLSCEPILDEVIMTFIYCHKLRKDRQD